MDRKLLYCYMKTGHVGHPNKLLKYEGVKMLYMSAHKWRKMCLTEL